MDKPDSQYICQLSLKKKDDSFDVVCVVSVVAVVRVFVW